MRARSDNMIEKTIYKIYENYSSILLKLSLKSLSDKYIITNFATKLFRIGYVKSFQQKKPPNGANLYNNIV
jgi:hypothetical protein